MRVRAPIVVLWLAAIAACSLAFWSGRPLRPAFPALQPTIEGTFTPNGEFQSRPLPYGLHVRRWGSWAGSDENRGVLRFGPFVAGNRLRIGVGGYPASKGIEIYLEREDTGERQPIVVRDVQEQWLLVDVVPAPAWKGKPVRLVAVDNATAVRGWLSITEPLRGGTGEGNTALYQTLAAWLLNGLLLAALWLPALDLVSARNWVPPHWAPLVAAGIVATAGYAVAMVYFASPAAGRIASVLVLVGGLAAIWARRTAAAESSREHRTVAVLLLTIGVFYLALLHLFPSSREFYDLAANRLREELPGDNTLPHNVAVALYQGDNLRPPTADWLVSDRPPLQTGWQLLTLPFTKALKLDDTTSTGTAAVWLQLLWIPAAYGLFRMLRMAPGRAAAWIVVCALSGFLAQNTLFTWPKLSAAAFGCGAFALWTFERRDLRRFALGAALAGLAWLSHGGIAFSFLALAPWVAWRVLRGDTRGWAIAAGVFLLFALPWFAFQKLYNPPGDRLIKWHLGGHPAKDDRGAWTVIREAYRTTPRAEIVAAKRGNFELQTLGDWPGLFDFRAQTAEKRRNNEFFSTGRALTWWSAGLALLPIALLFRSRRREIAPVAGAHAALTGWVAATLVIWCLLMFERYGAAIHQGSYATMLVLFILLSVWIELANRWLIWVIAGLQIATFVTTWGCANAQVNGAAVGWPFLTVATALMALVFVRGVMTSNRPVNASPAQARPAVAPYPS